MSMQVLFSGLAVLLLLPANILPAETRRPVSETSPMWLIHVDHPIKANPQDVINAIPEDIKPYVVLNLAMTTDSGFNGDSLAAAWLDVCNKNDMWAMVQPSAGVKNSMSDNDTAAYEDLFKKFPNLIGFDFSEQSWGYTADEFDRRLGLFAHLLGIANRYGGYLYVNDCMSASNPGFNTMAQLRKNGDFYAATKTYRDNFIIGDKTTMGYGYYDNESMALGAFLSGHAGHYAIRFDQYSWAWSGRGRVFRTEIDGKQENFGSLAWFSCPEALMGIPIVEHMLLSGATVLDGPEVPWVSSTFKGKTTPVFDNMVGDIFRRVLDKTIRMSGADEVRARTKIAVVNDVNGYNTPASLFTGLYGMDGELDGNKTWLKKSGRYPAIPLIYNGASEKAGFSVVVNQSAYGSRWPSDSAKINEFNVLFPSETTGDMYIAGKDNKWLSYNPAINTDARSLGRIPLKYNTCKEVRLDYAAHTFGVMTESGGKLEFYLNNYRTDKNPLWDKYPAGFDRTTLLNTVLPDFMKNPVDSGFRKSVITVSGCSGQPAYSITDLGSHLPSKATSTYTNGEFQLTVNHNGPLGISIDAAGNETGRLPVPVASNLVKPLPPSGKFPAADGVWLDAECGTVGSLWNKSQSATAAKGGYITIQSGHNGAAGASAEPEGQIAFEFKIPAAGNYPVWARLRSASGSDVPFWISMDTGAWLGWSGIGPYAEWGWDESRAFALSAGEHTLTVAFGNAGVDLDKFFIGSGVPVGTGTPSDNCTSIKLRAPAKGGRLNPDAIVLGQSSQGELMIDFGMESAEAVRLQVLSLVGNVLLEGDIHPGKYRLDIHTLKTGTYLVRLKGAGMDVIRKFANVRSRN